MTNTPPKAIKVHRRSKTLTLEFDDGDFELSFEYLRVYSPSAEVRGHSADQQVLQVGKKFVDINHIDRVGHYAIKIQFDDGHETGIYSWDYLRELGQNQDDYWQDYLTRLKNARASRDPDTQVVQLFNPKAPK